MKTGHGRKEADKSSEYSSLPLSREEKIKMNWLKRNRPLTALYIRDKGLEAAAQPEAGGAEGLEK